MPLKDQKASWPRDTQHSPGGQANLREVLTLAQWLGVTLTCTGPHTPDSPDSPLVIRAGLTWWSLPSGDDEPRWGVPVVLHQVLYLKPIPGPSEDTFRPTCLSGELKGCLRAVCEWREHLGQQPLSFLCQLLEI